MDRSPEHNARIGESLRRLGRGTSSTKRCPKCGETKSRAEFGLRKGGRFSSSYCLKCEFVGHKGYREDIAGVRYGRLLVLSYFGKGKDRQSLWNVKCDCGKEFVLPKSCMVSGSTASCGCLRSELNAANATKHGEAGKWRDPHAKSREYRAWCEMKKRCNSKGRHFEYYGARGIKVCDRWSDSFSAFLEDMGRCPPGLELDRKDNDGNYEPGNCRWATRSEQVINSRRFPRKQNGHA